MNKGGRVTVERRQSIPGKRGLDKIGYRAYERREKGMKEVILINMRSGKYRGLERRKGRTRQKEGSRREQVVEGRKSKKEM